MRSLFNTIRLPIRFPKSDGYTIIHEGIGTDEFCFFNYNNSLFNTHIVSVNNNDFEIFYDIKTYYNKYKYNKPDYDPKKDNYREKINILDNLLMELFMYIYDEIQKRKYENFDLYKSPIKNTMTISFDDLIFHSKYKKYKKNI